MSTKDFTANVISATKVVPDGNFKDSKASGIWDINEALDLIKGGNWPNVANINPSAFVSALFQTHLYTGTDDTQTITNNIDLTKGGLVWIKCRSDAADHHWCDTERGVGKRLVSNSTASQTTFTPYLSAFNNDGFEIGSSSDSNNSNNKTYVSWTFREQPKFFDIVTYTGDGNADRQIDHNLGSTPGMMIVKKYAGSTTRWSVYHRSLGTGKFLNLDDTAAVVTQNDHWQTAPNASQFTVETNGNINNSGDSYVAYLFAHNDDDGGFGAAGDQDIIKCDTYDGNGSDTGPVIDLGFEPQWIMIKRSSAVEDWIIFDNIRGLVVGGVDPELRPNKTQAEGTSVTYMDINATGFQLTDNNSRTNENGSTYIYMAIRRGGMQTPTAASSVFDVEAYSGNSAGDNTTVKKLTPGFAGDMALIKARNATQGWQMFDKLRGPGAVFTPNSTAAEENFASAYSGASVAFNNTELVLTGSGTSTGSYNNNAHNLVAWMWKRARGYFDIVAYSGNGTTGTTINHNLGVVPEMIWIRDRSTSNLHAYHKGLNGGTDPEDYTLRLNQNGGQIDTNVIFNDTAPTASVFSTGSAMSTDGNNYIAYLFATAAEVSKVGSFTQSGATNVDCGFTGDTPSFIFFKRYDLTGNDATNQFVFDSARGIVAGNDKSLNLNNTDAEVTNADMVDPYSGGFATTSSVENGEYVFYAIAATS